MAKEQKNTTEIELPEEQRNDDEYEPDFVDEEVVEEVREETKVNAKGLTSNINLSSKGMMLAIGIVGVIIVIVLFTGKLPIPNLSFLGGANEVAEDGKKGVASDLLGSYDEAAEEGESEEGTGRNETVSLVMRDLREYYPTYEITEDEENQRIVAIGTLDGQPHTMYLDFEGGLIEEIIGNTSVDETGAPIVKESEEGAETPDSVQIPLSEYNKYAISKAEQKFVKTESTDEYAVEVTSTMEKLIVEYERLPIKGSIPMIYSKVIETGEEVIFAVTLKQYARLEQKGTTVIQVTRSEGYGVKTIDQVVLVKWQD